MRKFRSPHLRRLKRAYQYSRRIVKTGLGSDHLIRIDVKVPRIRLGDDQAEWVVADRLVSSDSIVYSVGIGEDISFDQDLIARYRCRVFGWDPTPLATDFVGRSESPGGFMFLHYGLGAEDCVKEFGQADGGDRSFSSYSLASSKISLRVLSLKSMMSLLGHNRIDMLKMDIEGDEYSVIRKLADEKVIIPQLLVEFHHRWFSGISVETTRQHVEMLRQAGYLVFDVSASGGEISFLHKTSLNHALGG
jgi:FkbM family methyltransferase